ncbi:MAG: saccharopine dehydrogenase NADP-binding domain-containing protein [Verrucomicrobiota bacterium]
MTLLIYGANGYTGALIARRAAAQGVAAVLSGRHGSAVAALARELGLPHRVFGADDAPAAVAALRGAKALLNCAGPFSQTAAALVSACLRAQVHYLDITGEIDVLEHVAGRDAEARAAGVTVMPGAGFDVVPSDCLAAYVAGRLPSACHLALAFDAGTTMSRGTAFTSIENAAGGGVIRRDGRLVRVPSGWRTRSIDLGEGVRKAITIPWGDVATAFHSTGIGNVVTYVALPLAARVGLRVARGLGPLLASPAIKRALRARVEKRPPGPSAEQRTHGASRLWAEARDDNGAVVRARLRTPEPYELTTWTALDLAVRAARGTLPIGFQTPSRACGADYILQFPGVAREDVDDSGG